MAERPRTLRQKPAKTGRQPGSPPAAPRPAAPAEWEDGLPTTWLIGQVLIAMPAMADPRFAQTVIYLCAHTADGAMGIVLNRPLKQPSFATLLKQLDIAPAPPTRSLPLYSGGPVETQRGFVLHSADWTAEATLKVDQATALTASVDILRAVAGGGGPQRALLALGYAGWGPGQLDDEMRQNAWLSAPATEGLLWGGADAGKWRLALGGLGIDPLLLSAASGRA